jgi:dienelactone hydrolase
MINIFSKVLGIACLMTAVFSSACSKIKTLPVEYTSNGVTMKGYLAYDENIKIRRPGVLVVHEWWGLNDYAKKRARMLAELGYTALAVDMYGDGKQASTPDEAIKLSANVMQNFDRAKSNFFAAMDFLKKQSSVDPNRIAAIGYCFGGGIVLNMARQGIDLKGVVGFHGGLNAVKTAKPDKIKAKILVLNGAADKFTTSEMLAAFKKEMVDAKADFRIIDYPGAMHSFSNPDSTAIGKKFNIPIAYNAEADRKSWDDMKKFLDTIFRE